MKEQLQKQVQIGYLCRLIFCKVLSIMIRQLPERQFDAYINNTSKALLGIFTLFLEEDGVRDWIERLPTTRTDRDIHQAVKDWCKDPVAAEVKYGHISLWRTERVTRMTRLFCGQKEFNDDISGWNVGNVKNMLWMFYAAEKFNRDISGWDVGNVTSTSGMFTRAESFNQSISGWDVGKVQVMSSMFERAISFDQPLGGWNVENVMDMSHMFRECNCNPHIDNWVVKKVVRVAQMFRDNHAFNGRLCGWDVQQLKDADAMFLNCDSGYAVWHVVCGDWDINAYGTNMKPR